MNDKIIFEDTQKIRDAHCNIIDKFIELLDEKQDFSGFPELESYFSRYKEDFAEPHLSSEKHILQRFCLYRLSRNLMNRELKQFECDCCKEVTEFYQKTYDWLTDYKYETLSRTIGKYQLRHPDKDIVLNGDTMTSVFTPLKAYIKLKNGIKTTSSTTEDWEVFWIKNNQTFGISESAGAFITAAYSCANFLPVPQGFNTGRSNCGKWDSWDLTLHQIYQWYMDNPPANNTANNSALEKLFLHARNKNDTIIHCIKWLKTFDSWDDFVKKNFLQSFLDKDGVPVRFFGNHSLDYGLPKTLDEFDTFFKSAAACIQKRGEILNKHLKGKA